jgi:hypothetical protein
MNGNLICNENQPAVELSNNHCVAPRNSISGVRLKRNNTTGVWRQLVGIKLEDILHDTANSNQIWLSLNIIKKLKLLCNWSWRHTGL